MYIKSYNTNTEYNVAGPIYENSMNKIWCGTSETVEHRKCFVKILNYGEFNDKKIAENHRKMFVEELNTMKLVNKCTTRVPKLYDGWDDKKKQRFIIVMQKMSGTTLREWMSQHQKENLTPADVFVRSKIIEQICEIMLSINNKLPGIVHRDIKPENIFIEFDKESRKWKASIIDFGCANLNYIRNLGTASYQAPEQKKKLTTQISYKTDIFAIGQIFYELLVGTVPQIGKEYQKRASDNFWVKNPIIPDYLMEYNGMKKIADLLEQMTRFNANDRISYSQIIPVIKNTRIS